MAETNRNSGKSEKEIYEELINDNQLRESLLGHPAEEFDEGLAMNYHNDENASEDFRHVKTDDEIEKVAKELLHNSSRIDGSDITVTVNKCNITLSGTVKTQDERDYAVSVVKLIHGVGDINSEIIVKRNEGILPTDIGRNP